MTGIRSGCPSFVFVGNFAIIFFYDTLFTDIFLLYLRTAFLAEFSCQRVGKFIFLQRAPPKMRGCVMMPNFRASEWENSFSFNERRRKCGVYVINAELAQLVEQLIRPKMNKEVWVVLLKTR